MGSLTNAFTLGSGFFTATATVGIKSISVCVSFVKFLCDVTLPDVVKVKTTSEGSIELLVNCYPKIW